jgi:hypothetical protein
MDRSSSAWAVPGGGAADDRATWSRSTLPRLTERPRAKEATVLVLAWHQTPTLTRERYEEVVRRITGGKTRIESTADLPFEGLLVHAAGEGSEGFCVFDVFESESAVESFRTALGSVPRRLGSWSHRGSSPLTPWSSSNHAEGLVIGLPPRIFERPGVRAGVVVRGQTN